MIRGDFIRLALLALFAGLAGCASAGAGGTARTDQNLITSEEIQSVGAPTAYEAIDRLRPRWLRVTMERSFNRSTEVVIFLDQHQLDNAEALRNVDADEIVRIRWLDSAQAGMLPGLGSRHVEGAIVVETL